MAKDHKEGVASVESFDAITKALESAMVRVKDMAPSMGVTLVDTIPAKEWAAWDASGETALVADSAGIDGIDELDSLDECEPQAA
jgi:hypothetical protein